VSGTNISCACEKSPPGISPYCYVGDGFVDDIVVRYGGFLRTIKVLMTLAKADGDIVKLSIVELYRLKNPQKQLTLELPYHYHFGTDMEKFQMSCR